jgi:hypothetical protein
MERESMYEGSRHQHMQRCDEWVSSDVAIDGDNDTAAVVMMAMVESSPVGYKQACG